MSNRKNYQELIFEIAELKYEGEQPQLNLDQDKFDKFKYLFDTTHRIINKKIVLLNTGCGPVFPNKKWTYEGFKELIDYLLKDDVTLLLTGGKSEVDRNKKLFDEFKSSRLINTTDKYTIEEFAYLINLSNVVVSGDTAALQMAIALKKSTIAFFGPGPWQETDLFGRGIKFVRKELDCLGCHDQFICPYDRKCMRLIESKDVYDSIKEML